MFGSGPSTRESRIGASRDSRQSSRPRNPKLSKPLHSIADQAQVIEIIKQEYGQRINSDLRQAFSAVLEACPVAPIRRLPPAAPEPHRPHNSPHHPVSYTHL